MRSSSNIETSHLDKLPEPETRFAFGKNWQRFLRYITEERISEAESSLGVMLDLQDFVGRSFLDIGCGSGLFSLAAIRLGAAKVHSFDYDAQSVACAAELKRRFSPGSTNWTMEQGSVLDPIYLRGLGRFDIVYSWGVLHHTGNMWQALEDVTSLVAPYGMLFIALYNDQGIRSRIWRSVKRLYVRAPAARCVGIAAYGSYLLVGRFFKDLIVLRTNPFTRYYEQEGRRGMSYLTDLLDWLGGYPFEVARPESVLDFFEKRGFESLRLKTVGDRIGPNEFVFRRRAAEFPAREFALS